MPAFTNEIILALQILANDLRRQLEQKDGVIAALQQNIAELTKPNKTVISNVTMTVYPDPAEQNPKPVTKLAALCMAMRDQSAKPAIPAAALTPAKLPRFF